MREQLKKEAVMIRRLSRGERRTENAIGAHYNFASADCLALQTL